MGIESFVTESLTSASTSGFSLLFPILAAALAYFQYEALDNEAPPIDVPSEMLLPSYHFIVIGGGSAGMCPKFSLFCTNTIRNININISFLYPSSSFCIRSRSCQPSIRN